MFFAHPTLIEILKDKLKIFYGNKVDEVSLPPTVSQNVEVLDSTGFNKLVDELLSKTNLREKKVVIVLSDEVTFHKNESPAQGDQQELQVAQFIDTVPFDQNKIALKKILDKDMITLVAANKDFYQPIQQAVLDHSGKVVSVVPLVIFKEKLGVGDDLEVGEARKILSQQSLIKNGNFLSGEVGKKSSSHHYLLLLIFYIILFLAIGTVAAVYFKVLTNPLKLLDRFKINKTITKEASPAAQISESTESAKEASDSAKLKEDLTIQVFNGSGISGQAAKVKGELEDLGYTNIETGNAEGVSNKNTVVVFAPTVSTEIKEEIVNKLKETFTTIESQDGDEEEEFDISITTGTDIVE